jgi:hypothetical protein
MEAILHATSVISSGYVVKVHVFTSKLWDHCFKSLYDNNHIKSFNIQNLQLNTPKRCLLQTASDESEK